jgi:hypothetical protein
VLDSVGADGSAGGASMLLGGAFEKSGPGGGGGGGGGGGVSDGAGAGGASGCIGAGGDGEGAAAGVSASLCAWWCEVEVVGGIGTNSPARHVCGAFRIEGSFRNRSAWPHDLQIRVPNESSPFGRSESVPALNEPPVLRSFAQTKSFAPQLLHTGGTEDT